MLTSIFQRTKVRIAAGFTIVELLIVIVIIGILTSIVTIAFTGVSSRAVAAAMQANLENVSKQLGVYAVTEGAYPADISSIAPPEGTLYQYTYDAGNKSYCVTVTSSKDTTLAYHIDSRVGRVESGLCSGHTLPSGGGGVVALAPNAGVVTTIAGSGNCGTTSGTGLAAEFCGPRGLDVDSSGNIYIANTGYHNIRKITPAGVVTTLAGSGGSGTADGTGVAAQFSAPGGVAVDASGTIYVADTNNNLIRKITSAGVVTTLAGNAFNGATDGTGTSASFDKPRGVAVDAGGNVYVADSYNHRIRKITPAGVVTTLAGSSQGYAEGMGTSAQFYYPSDVAVDTNGAVYVTDYGNNAIRKITPAGVVTTLAGSTTSGSADGTGTAASFQLPNGITVNSEGTVYVADTYNSRIRMITPTGVVTTLAGSSAGYVNATGAAAKFNYESGIAVDAAGALYVSDSENHRIRKIE